MTLTIDDLFRGAAQAKAMGRAGEVMAGQAGHKLEPHQKAQADAEALTAALEKDGHLPPKDVAEAVLTFVQDIKDAYLAQKAEVVDQLALPDLVVGEEQRKQLKLRQSQADQWLFGIDTVLATLETRDGG